MPCLSRIKNVRLAGVFSLLTLGSLLLAGCAAQPQLSATAQAQLPARSYIPDVPFHSQRDYQCGPASLAMVLGASGVHTSVDTLTPQLFLPGREGSVQPEMLATVRRHGRISYPLDGRFDTLLSEVDAGHPVVVLQNLALAFHPLWHYAVVIGYDLNREQLVLHSGEQARQVITLRRFNATWARSQHWAMVALPPGQLPHSISARVAADSIAAFEAVAGADAALPAWQAVTARWPDYALGWFALGNALHAAQDLQAAAQAFTQATQADASLAVAWLNLGLTQQGLGDVTTARASLQQAASLPGSWQAQARQALAALSGEGEG